MRSTPPKTTPSGTESAGSSPSPTAPVSTESARAKGEQEGAPAAERASKGARPEPGGRSLTEPVRDMPEKPDAADNGPGKTDSSPEVAEMTKPQESEKPLDAARPSADRKPEKPARPGRAEDGSAGRAPDVSASHAALLTDDEAGTDSPVNRQAAPQAAPSGAKSGKIASEDRKSVV